MQNKKSKVLVIALIVGLVAILSVSSLAWFTAKDDVTNTIKFEDKFSIDVYETDETGAAIVDEAGKTVGTTYENIMPGQKIHKDPTVWNNGDQPEYVRVTVTLDDGLTWMNIMHENGYAPDEVKLADFFKGFEEDKWTCTVHNRMSPDIFSGDHGYSWVFYLDAPLAAGAKETLFTDVIIPKELTVEQANSLNGAFTIKVEAEAIQANYLPETVTNAQEAFALLENN